MKKPPDQTFDDAEVDSRLGLKKTRPKPRVSAKAKVIQYLSRREHAAEELKQKLSGAGYEAPEIQVALDWAQSHSFQSDERFAVSLHRRRASTFGDRAIESELGQLGLKGTLQNLAADSPTEDLLPESERAFSWMHRRYSSQLQALYAAENGVNKSELFKLKAKAWQALTRRGFEIRNIDAAWRRLTVELNSDQ